MFSVHKLSSAYYVCCIFWDALKNTLTMGANTMNPDQTALMEQSDLGPYCLKYRLPKCVSRCESRQHLL